MTDTSSRRDLRTLCAGIDVGTNSVKMIIADLADGTAQRVYDQSLITRLGEGMQAQNQRLREAPMRRTLDAIEEFTEAAKQYGVTRIAAIGTAALRDATNREEFLRRVKERCDLTLEVISGEEEARLSYRAVRLDPLWRSCTHLMVIDIGGGSTELIRGEPEGDRIAERVSINLGAVRLTERFLKSDPPTIAQLSAANKAVTDGFADATIVTPSEPGILVGVGGTLTNLAAMEVGDRNDPDALHGYVLSADHLETRIAQLASSTVEQRKEIPGLDPRRADIILGGAILLSQAFAHIGVATVQVSVRGLRWGLLYDRFLS